MKIMFLMIKKGENTVGRFYEDIYFSKTLERFGFVGGMY
jgi:hypothetical protein